MPGQLFIAPGDITQLHADAVAYSTSTTFARGGDLYSAFRARFPGFADQYAELGRRHAGCHTGDAFWLPLSPDRKPYGVVVVATVGVAAHSEDPAARAVRAALETAVARLRKDLGRTDRLLVALPTFRVGMGGARRDRLNSARAQIAVASAVMERMPDVDVAFIAYTPDVYHIFLEARRQILPPPPATPDLPEGLTQSICAGECVAFVGAGLSRAADLPDWGQLIDRLARELGIPNNDQIAYLDLAQWYREHFGAARLATVIRETFGTTLHRPTLAHYLLLSLPVRTVFTTNYDDLVERALEGLKHFPVRVVSQEDVPRTGQAEGTNVVKLHGDAARPEEIVLCRDDYDAFFEMRPAMALLLEGLLLNRTFFFLGYGLKDPNFRQLFSRIGRLLQQDRRPAFATAFLGEADGGSFLVKQWKEKGLHLIDMPKGDFPERERHFLSFLDRLAEHVAAQAPRLFLAPDVPVSDPRLERLYSLLADQVGTEVEALVGGGAADPKLAPLLSPLSELLTYLTSQGWRPRGNLSQMWERLATALPESAERRRLLVAALGAAERFSDAERVRQQLVAGNPTSSERSPSARPPLSAEALPRTAEPSEHGSQEKPACSSSIPERPETAANAARDHPPAVRDVRDREGSDLGRALAVAVTAVRAAGDLLRSEFYRPGGPRGSGGHAEADGEAERVIRDQLLKAFPGWGIRGEELGSVAGKGPFLWLIDPNDGTSAFLKGWRGSAVSVALLRDGLPVLGVVYAFAYPDDEGDLFAWAEGCPFTRNDKLVGVHLDQGSLGPETIVFLSQGADKNSAANTECVRPARYIALPSIAYRLARVAAGDGIVAVSLNGPGAWDYAAGHALLCAVGGVLLDQEGKEVTYSPNGHSSTSRCFGGSPEAALELSRRNWHKVRLHAQVSSAYPLTRPSRGGAVKGDMMLARAQGCLLGQLAGDSLGGLVEFQSAAAIAREYPGGCRDLKDGGTWKILAGQPTDDSELALMLARSLVQRGNYDAEAALTAYLHWYSSHPFDVGNTVGQALRAAASGGDAPERARRAKEAANRASQSNGSLMRISPLGIFGAGQPTKAVAWAREDSGLTHPNPVCQDACAVFVAGITAAIAADGLPERAYTAALAESRQPGVHPDVLRAVEMAAGEPPKDFASQMGWVLIALQNAFYQLLHARSLEEGVVATVMFGGDSDTNAAIAGALLGAVHTRDAVPPHWTTAVLSCRPLPPKVPKRNEHPRPVEFWPVDALHLAESLLAAGNRVGTPLR